MYWTVFIAGRWFRCAERMIGCALGYEVWEGSELVGTFTSLSSSARTVRGLTGSIGRNVSGPMFWAIQDPERCSGCGVSLSGYRPKHGWHETYEILRAEQRNGTRRHITRHTVLGKMKELRATEFREHREQCERG